MGPKIGFALPLEFCQSGTARKARKKSANFQDSAKIQKSS